MKFRTKCLIAAALLVGATACNNDLTNINQNPNGPVNVPAPSLLSQIIQNATSGFHGVTYNDINAAGLWIQYYAELQYRDEDKYIIRPGTTGGWGFYSGSLENSQRMIDQGVSTSTPNWAAVGRIMKSYIFSELTDAMGDLPYSQALQGASGNLTPAYDTQQQIYTGLFKDLTSADSEINPALIGFSTGDLMYSGDMTEWAKFAASLRLRLAIHLSNRDPATGKAQALAAMAAGVFQSNNDNAQLMYLASSPNQNPVYTNVHVDGRDDFGLSKTLVDSMLSWNDPRLPVYAQLNKDAVPKYEGLPNGLNDGAGPPIASISRIGAMWRETPAAPLNLMTYSEVLFLEAEAAQRTWIAGNPAVLYDSAIAASMEQYGIDGATIAAYLAQPRVVYNAATGLAQIAYQKWVSLFLQGNEAWTEVRRTGVPTFVPGPNATLTKIPERLPYSNAEEVLNQVNVDAAVARQGFSSYLDLTKPLWFTGR